MYRIVTVINLRSSKNNVHTAQQTLIEKISSKK